MAGVSHTDLNVIPARALNIEVRERLGFYLNIKKPLLSRDKFHRDYRGLARQMRYQYHDIINFELFENPTVQMLHDWSERSDSTIGLLIKYLQIMGRHDIVQDLQPIIVEDAELYLQSIRHQRRPLQVPEVSSCRMNVDDSDLLSTRDADTGECTLFDAFACYAEADMEFVKEVASFLESEEIGFKLYIPHRDMLAGLPEYPTSLKLIEERCPRVLIFLSPDFIKQPILEELVNFAGTPGTSKMCRKLVPIMCKTCDGDEPLPLLVKKLHYIDFTNGEWNNLEKRYKLVSSLRSNFSYCSFSSTGSQDSASQFKSDSTQVSTSYQQTTDIDSEVGFSTGASEKIVGEKAFPDSAMKIASELCCTSEVQKLPEQSDSYVSDYCKQSSSSIATSGYFSQTSAENIQNEDS